MPVNSKQTQIKWIKIDEAADEFASSVKGVLKQLLKKIIALLKKNGYSVVISRTVSSQLSDQTKAIHKALRGWPKGKTWDHLDGIQDGNRIIIAQLHRLPNESSNELISRCFLEVRKLVLDKIGKL